MSDLFVCTIWNIKGIEEISFDSHLIGQNHKIKLDSEYLRKNVFKQIILDAGYHNITPKVCWKIYLKNMENFNGLVIKKAIIC